MQSSETSRILALIGSVNSTGKAIELIIEFEVTSADAQSEPIFVRMHAKVGLCAIYDKVFLKFLWHI